MEEGRPYRPSLTGLFAGLPFSSGGYCVLLFLYLTLNSVLNLTNKWALSWFSFPLLLTACHMAFSFLMLLPLMLTQPLKSRHRDTLRRQWKGLCTIGLFLGLNISLNNTALVNMTLSLNQVIRASIPVFTCLLSMLFEHKIPTKQEASALVVLTIGVMIAMWKNNVAGSPAAITLCLIGTVCNAGMMSMSGTVLSGKVDALQLAFYTAPVSFTAILPVFLYRESAAFLAFQAEHNTETYIVVLGTSAIALTYNVVHSIMIQQTSAVTTTVIGQAKIIGLLILSALLLGEKKTFTPNMTAGTVLAVIGFFMYSQLKLKRAAHDASLPARGEEEMPLNKKGSDLESTLVEIQAK